MEIHVLYKQGLSCRKIARELGISRNTVRKYLEQNSFEADTKTRPRQTKLEPYHQYLNARIEAAKPDWIPAPVLFREIAALGYDGGIAQLRRYIRPLKLKEPEPTIRFETSPGVQMQIDFTTIRRGKNPLKAFVATLGYSRACFVRFYNNETIESWIDGIKEACHYFGGVPKEVLCDNAKALVVERDYYGEGQHRWGNELLDLSQVYGFKLKACKPYRAKTKGKVERFNHYLKNNFLLPLKVSLKEISLEIDVSYANAHIGAWLKDVAHQRIHGTTNATPESRLNEEEAYLLPLPVELTINDKGYPLKVPYTPVIPEVMDNFQHPISTYDEVLYL